jgi:hypothetical protein
MTKTISIIGLTVALLANQVIEMPEIFANKQQAGENIQDAIIEKERGEYYSLSILAYNNEALLRGESSLMDNAAFLDGPVMYLPIRDVAKLAGCGYQQTGEKAVVTYDGASMEYEAGKKTEFVSKTGYAYPLLKDRPSFEYPYDSVDTTVTDFTPRFVDGVLYAPVDVAYFPDEIFSTLWFSTETRLVLFRNFSVEKLIYEEDGAAPVEIEIEMLFDDLPKKFVSKLTYEGIRGKTADDFFDAEFYSSNEVSICVARVPEGQSAEGFFMDGRICAVEAHSIKFRTMSGLRQGNDLDRAFRLYGVGPLYYFDYSTAVFTMYVSYIRLTARIGGEIF